MEKESGIINKVFGAMEVVDGAKKVKKEFNNAENKYDAKLGVSTNHLKPPKLASEELDELLKIAGVGQRGFKSLSRAAGSTITDGAKAVKKGIGAADKFTMDNASKAVASMKGGDIKQGLKSGAKALPGLAAGAAGIVGAGKLATKAIDHFDKRPSEENKLESKVIGAGLSTALALSAMTNRSLAKPLAVASKASRNKVLMHPIDKYKASSPTAKTVIEGGQNAIKGVNKALNSAIGKDKSGAFKAMKDATNKNINSKRNTERQAQKIIGSVNNALSNSKRQQDMVGALKDLSAREKDNFVNSFMLSNSKASAAEALKAWKTSADKSQFDKASRAAVPVIKRLNKNAGEEIDELLKIAEIASPNSAKKIIPAAFKGVGAAGKYLGDKILTPALTAMASTAAPVIATTIMSQRMINQAKEEKEQEQAQAQSQSQAPQQMQQPQTLVIKLDGYGEPKMASEDNAIDVGDVLDEISEEINKELKNSSALQGSKVHIGHGQKKKFRMQGLLL